MALKAKKIREMGGKEMDDKLRELRLELSKENATSEIGTVKNPGRIRDIRRSIARMLTVKGEKEEVTKRKVSPLKEKGGEARK